VSVPLRNSPELLAPAGGPQSLRAAIANGADAVYLGVEMLNARRGAENFTLATLGKACDFAHLHGVRVYLTANVVVLPSEADEALQMVDAAWVAGVDAVIIQDLGLLWMVRQALPHVRVHASTQMNAHNSATVRALGLLGVSRVTLAREVSIEEIALFSAIEGIEVESFVHGALCMCYSGQCLMSSLIGRRSANRGLCAQPCRLPYELVDASGTLLETPGAHLLSPKDLAGLTLLPQLVGSGVSALKIEGRMKSAEYVALVTGVYRRALDRAVASPNTFEVRDGEMSTLSESFSRGFSEAYLRGERGNEMMSYRRPNNRGVPVGRVADVVAGRATVALDSSLDADDTIEFWTSAGRFAQRVGTLAFDGHGHEFGPAGMKVDIEVEEPVSAGDRVFRVRNSALSAAAARSFAEGTESLAIPLEFDVRVVSGEPLRVEVRDAEGRAGRAEGSVVEPARTKSVTAEQIAEHIGRLGGTPYEIGSWSLELSTDVGIGFSALHNVRRSALESYESAVLMPWAARSRRNPEVPAPEPRVHRVRGRRPAIVACVVGMDAAEACLAAGADRVMVPVADLRGETPTDKIVPLLPRIARDSEVAAALRWAQRGTRVLAANLGLLQDAAAAGAIVEAGWSLNAVNVQGIAQLRDMGASLVWLSPELSGRQIAEVAGASPLEVGTSVYGRQELMVTEHCVLMAQGPCDQRCGTCDRRTAAGTLRDRKGYEFPVRTDVSGRSHIYNSVPLDLLPALEELLDAGVTALRLDLEVESPADAASAVGLVIGALERTMSGIDPTPRQKDSATTSGHFFRGVL
jgi:putative protease